MKRDRDGHGRDGMDMKTATPTTTTARPTHPTISIDGFRSLPLAMLALVWSFAEDLDISDDVCANANHDQLTSALSVFETVCRSWYDSVHLLHRDLLSNVALVDVGAYLTNLSCDIDSDTPPLIIPLRTLRANTHAASEKPITDVRVLMGEVAVGFQGRSRGQRGQDEQPLMVFRVQRDCSLSDFGQMPVMDWEKMLAPYASTITRLDLSKMLIFTPHMGDLLRTAGRVCPNVKSVTLPRLETNAYENEALYHDNMQALCEALKMWFNHNGGLTVLSVPYVGKYPLLIGRYLHAVAQYCPEIEYLDGEALTFKPQCSLELITCDALYNTPPSFFHSLWRKCTKLRYFNTVVLPMSRVFYGELCTPTPRPCIQELVLSQNAFSAGEYDDLGSSFFQTMVQSFPGIRKLTVMFGATRDERWSAGEVFDDAFLIAVIQNCTELQKVNLQSHEPFSGITTKGLSALFSHPTCSTISIHSLAALESSFVDAIVRGIEMKSAFRLSLTVLQVHDTMWGLLEQIAQMENSQFDGVSISISLSKVESFGYQKVRGDRINGSRHTSDEIQRLYDAIKRKHGNTVRVHLHTTAPPAEEGDHNDSKGVLFDSLVLSINDPQGFCCTRAKSVDCGYVALTQDLCGQAVREDGVFERDAKGVLLQYEYCVHRANVRVASYPVLVDKNQTVTVYGLTLERAFGLLFGEEEEEEEEEEAEEEG